MRIGVAEILVVMLTLGVSLLIPAAVLYLLWRGVTALERIAANLQNRQGSP